MKTRTFQEIYDFCRTDDTYRSYFEASATASSPAASTKHKQQKPPLVPNGRSGGFSVWPKSAPLAIFSARAHFPSFLGAAGETCREALRLKASKSTAPVGEARWSPAPGRARDFFSKSKICRRRRALGMELGGLRPSEARFFIPAAGRRVCRAAPHSRKYAAPVRY